ncbi:phosphotransferase enzyme family protein [Cytobacillus sp. FJAT-54145]|uniref:Phosphotransferase enzyme family protein n=1 Tax=Cytobacillus spartinae TaxID=3299023 RepID=A0ABW6KH44_9BACI
MEAVVENVFTKEILQYFLQQFNLNEENKKLGDFENYVFEVFKDQTPFILRITHSSHRSEDQLLSELDWVNYLHNQGVNVPKVLTSNNGKLVESAMASDHSLFFGCLFTKADGFPVKVRNDKHFNPPLFYAWGKTIGKMHHATKDYKPEGDVSAREHWDEEELLNIEKYIPNNEQLIIQNTKELIQKISSLPKNKDIYGLIHTDVHSGNFFFDGEEIHVFDFDDCCHHWFASDIAIPLYYSALWHLPDAEKNEGNAFSSIFLSSFIKGYETENKLPPDWKEHLPLFLQLRDVLLYSVFHKKYAPEDRNERINQLLEEFRSRIEKKETIVDII